MIFSAGKGRFPMRSISDVTRIFVVGVVSLLAGAAEFSAGKLYVNL
jgi:hypothetical protein